MRGININFKKEEAENIIKNKTLPLDYLQELARKELKK
jgi:hypothetical protein